MIKQCVTRIRIDIQRTTQSQRFVNNKRHQISHDAEACVNERRISNGMVQRGCIWPGSKLLNIQHGAKCRGIG